MSNVELLVELESLREENAYLRKELVTAREHRDSFRAVLEGAEYRDIEGIANGGVYAGRELGGLVASITKSAIAEAEVYRAIHG